MKLSGINQLSAYAKSIARPQIENAGVGCPLALDEHAPEGLHMQGINQFHSPDCWA